VLENSSLICNFSPASTNSHRTVWIVFRHKSQRLAWSDVTVIKFRYFFGSCQFKAGIIFERGARAPFKLQPVVTMSNVISFPCDWLKRYITIIKFVFKWPEACVFLEFFSVFFQLRPKPVNVLSQKMSRLFYRLERNSVRFSAKATSQLEMLKNSSLVCEFSPFTTVNTHSVVRVVFRHKP